MILMLKRSPNGPFFYLKLMIISIINNLNKVVQERIKLTDIKIFNSNYIILNRFLIQEKILKNELTWPENIKVSDELKNLISAMLNKDF